MPQDMRPRQVRRWHSWRTSQRRAGGQPGRERASSVETETPSHRERSMTDIVDASRRSYIMSRIRGRDTEPELAVRSIAHRLGFRFRLHRRDLPGSPDVVFPRHRAVVFVHGCFWHRHGGCRYAYEPKSRIRFWTKKFESNVARDAQNEAALRDLGWRVLVIWECETGDPGAVAERLLAHLQGLRSASAGDGMSPVAESQRSPRSSNPSSR